MFKRTQNLRLSIIKQMELEAAKYPDVVSLAQGIPSFDTPGCIKRRVERALKRGVVAKYSLSPGLPELRELIEAALARENMLYDWQKEILVTAGSIEAITASLLAVTMPGDEVIIPDPTYTSYREAVVLAGCRPVYAPLDESRCWALDINTIKDKITDKTRVIFYCNPNNPTGTVYSREQLKALAELARENDLFVISDEVYKDFIFDGIEYFSLAELPEYRDIVIRIFSFSKAYAMTGWRVAYLNSDERNVREIIKVHDSLVTCAPVISQYAAMGALEMGAGDIKYFREEYIKRRDLICSRLDEIGDRFDYVRPTSAYFVFPRIRNVEMASWDFARDMLKKIQVAVVPGMAFGPTGEHHIRVSFGRTVKDINRAFDRIAGS